MGSNVILKVYGLHKVELFSILHIYDKKVFMTLFMCHMMRRFYSLLFPTK